MRLIVLNDNIEGNCPAEHGLSFLIEDDKKILFDVGPSEIFLKNSKKLNINLDEIDTVILSHGHWDHGNGLKFIKNKKLICHPECFIKRFRKKDDSYIGLPITLEEAKRNFQLILTTTPYKVTENITFLGEIPRNNDFEAKSTTFYKGEKEEDYVIDDSALAIKSKNGLIIIAGCSHAGICNIVEYAKKVTKIKKVYAVIGGFHLKQIDNVTLKTIDYFKKEKIELIYPSHCVEKPVLEKFKCVLNSGTIRSGDIIDF
jgi:7,8-dihydropterin-6-yl-methyl-4-(beta-D-ribofuranosyl)aminobenzene 5'-phosphate synthase